MTIPIISMHIAGDADHLESILDQSDVAQNL